MIKYRFLSMLLCAALVLTLLPATAQAAEHTIDTGGTYELADLGVGDGDTISIGAGLTVTLVGNSATTYTNVEIECAAGVILTLSDVKIDNSGNSGVCALSLTGSGNTLTLTGDNVLKSGGFEPGVKVLGGTELSISGTGSLLAAGGQAAPGMGGVITNSGTINISGGTVTANGGGSAAGIGGGSSVSGGTVNISGGTVTANGSYNGAGIGGGWGGNGGTINISGGTVKANGGTYGAGIGSGGGYNSLPNGGTTTISGGTVTATGGDYSAGIGGGAWYSSGNYYGDDYYGNVYISGGSVNAIGKTGAQRIGAGYLSSNNGTLKTASDGENVYLTTVTLYNAPANASLTSLTTGPAYGTHDMDTDTAGKLYLYLPNSAETTSATAAAEVYSGSVTTTDDHAANGLLIASGDTYTLSTPANLAWNTTAAVKATWNPVAYASSYTLQLYKNGAAQDTAVTGITGTEYDFTAAITTGGSGSYTFTVTAIGNGGSIQNSVESGRSAAYVVSENVTFSASQTGGTSGAVNSTGILLTFSSAVTGLTADKISIINGTGSVTKGTLSGSGTEWTIALTAVAAEGGVTVSIADFEYFHVTNNPQAVTVYKIDSAAPVLTSGSVNRTSDTAATIGFTTNEAGTAYYTAVTSGAAAPTSAEIVNNGTSLGPVSGTVTNKSVVLTAGANDIYVVVMDAAGNRSAPLLIQAAAYVPPTHIIAASATAGGSISPSGAVSVTEGDDLTFTITPNANYAIQFVKVDGFDQGTISSYSFTGVTADHTINAAFRYTGGSSGSSYISRTLTDRATGVTVSGSIHRRAALTVDDIALHPEGTCTACDAIRNAQDDNQLLLGFDISLTRGFSGPLTVSIPVGKQYDGRTVTILHCVNGRLETIAATVSGGMATFTVTALSPFAVTTGFLVPDRVVTDPPKTGGAARPWGIALIGLAVVCTSIPALKRRRS